MRRKMGARASLRLQPPLEAFGHHRERVIGVTKRRDASRPQRIELAAPPAALRRRVAHPRAQQALPLEAVERGVDRINRYVAPRPLMDFPADRSAVGVVLEPQHAEEDELLEIAEDGSSALEPHCGGYG